MAKAEFDYIVIGAGSAGCVVAGRLGEAGHKVLLLEAGGAALSPFIHVPLGYSMLYNNPKLNWCFNCFLNSKLFTKILSAKFKTFL